MYTVFRSGVAGVAGVSLLALSTGLAASPAPETVPALAAAVAAAPNTDTIAAPPAPVDANLVTPEALQTMVDRIAAHPRPVRREVECMARTVYHEASNQTLRGQLAVAQVILNRVKASAFPKSVCAVVGQPGQFASAPMAPASAPSRPWRTAVAISLIAREERVAQVAPGALFFHAAYVRPSWSQTRERIAQIGDHIFYR